MIKLDPNISLGKLIKNQFGDQFLFPIHRRSFEQIDYKTSFIREFDNIFDKENTLYIIVGTDSGMMVKQLLKTPPEKGSIYLFIDFPEVIERTKKQYELRHNKRIVVSDVINWKNEAEKLNLKTYGYINKIEIIQSFATQYHHVHDYILLWNHLFEQVNQLKWEYGSTLDSEIFLQCQIKNLCEEYNPAKKLMNHYAGKSALILAGGPSLDQHIQWIEQHQDKYLIIAVSRIANRLRETAIIPDIFVSVDPNPINFNVSKEILYYSDKSILVHSNHIYPPLLGSWDGSSLYLNELYPWEKGNSDNIQGIGPTVTNSAIYLAIQIEIKEIILFGVDLCFTPEGFTHVSGTIERLIPPKINLNKQTVLTNEGNEAETNSSYFSAIESIAKLGELGHSLGCTFYNPSATSAHIENIEYKTLNKLNIPNISLEKSLYKKINRPDNNILGNHYKQLTKELHKVKNKLEEIVQLSKKGLEYNHLFFAGNTPEKNFKYKIKMDKIESKLKNKQLKNISDIAIKFGAKEFLNFLVPNNDQVWTNDEIKMHGDVYYHAFNTGALRFLQAIKKQLEKIEFRQLELASPPISAEKISDLLYFWHSSKESTNARIFILKRYNNELYKYLSNKQEKLVSCAINNFTIELEVKQKDSPICVQMDRENKLEGIEVKLVDLFNRKDDKGLENIINTLGLYEDNEEKESLIHLAKGYLYELKDDSSQAVNEYQYSSNPLTIELSLKRIAAIALDSSDLLSAESALKLLCSISEEYLPELAELYNITKNYEQAVQTYADYLDINPENIIVLVKLGRLYLKTDNLEGAEFIFNHILELDPNNELASEQLSIIHSKIK